ncbi:MAG: hypothetical protein E7612_05590 [Ruminococcaceae bacterium]|nr:hypothetical protein [Oscillospiraceae bacterium]
MIDTRSELDFYLDVLYGQILPFWENYAFDEEHGGIFTCISNDCTTLISTDKYIWSQGRALWLLSRIISHGFISGKRLERISDLADKTAEFLMKNAILENGSSVFLTDREGRKKLCGDAYDLSTYVDCFVILGLAEYATVKKDGAALEFALNLYRRVKELFEKGKFRTDPDPTPGGYITHGVTMILTNTARTLADAMEAHGHRDAEKISSEAYGYAKYTLDTFADENDIMRELVRVDGSFDNESRLGRYANPGHIIEDAWFMETEWKKFGDEKRLERTRRVLKNALRLGWDTEYSGILHFVDMEGGIPHGAVYDYSEPMVRKTAEDYGAKLWWVHSEALYSTLLFGEDAEIAEWYPKIREYTLNTFPNRENDRGEWIQIRSRDGKPENRIVALPVKDPYHIIRNLLYIIEFLQNNKT